MINVSFVKRYLLYIFRWQLSTPLLAGVLLLLQSTDTVIATVIANAVGGLLFFWVDRFIFTSHVIDVVWDVKDTVICVDCGAKTRGYRVVRAGKYDKRLSSMPEYRCEDCSQRKTESLRKKGVNI